MDPDKKAIGAAIKAYIARLGISREEFSHRYGIPMGTLEKIVTGLFTDKSLDRLERQVGRSFRNVGTDPDLASEDLGGYRHSDYRHYEGHYTLIRNSFDSADRICLFPVSIDWDDAKPGLRINGQTEAGYKKFAYLAFPKASPYLFVQANEKGWMSLMIFSTVDVEDTLQGSLLTAGNIGGGTYAPFFLPVLLRKEKGIGKKFQEINQTEPHFASLKKQLGEVVLQKFVRSPWSM